MPELNHPSKNIELSSLSFEEDLERSHFAIYRGSTTIIKAIQYGLIPLYYERSNEISIDPLYEIQKEKINLKSIEDFKLLNEIPKQELINRQYRLIEYVAPFFSPLDYDEALKINKTVMTFSFVIPTKNRPTELATVFNAILAQTRLPEQVIIIDQSSPDKVIKDKLAPLAKKAKITLDYIHDESIKGLVQAKAASIQYNSCDYISFFDDDIVHKTNYLEAIEQAFMVHSDMIGVNGVIINNPQESFIKRTIFRLTHFGLYKDNRQRVIRSLKSNTS